ncbi:DUF192 domain-containing protein [Yoonia vestfoldensis]|uniref:Putative ACR n=1 Tax=Yoonia vestfoldensis TaxID=245188 RepID=A0A1Y0EAE9_9RHOB|nr:DUF192 domain-containing protein [Yoonia vestfoldensis]ARU00586.1 putative ACR [Yoonia vestfoldensis]
MKSLILALVLGAVAQLAAAACAEDRVTIRGDWGQATFTVEIADTPATRARGLMYVETMPRMAGMLFIYDRPQPVSFWMKNTLIPLDMIFASPAGEILRVHENAIPGDLTPIPGGDGVQMVLEINGGLSARLGIAAGDIMQHPAFGPDAISPCGEKTDS